MKTKRLEHQYVLEQLQQIARGLAETFAPFCEVVVHDLTQLEPVFPELVADYSNRFFPTAVAPGVEESLAPVVSQSLRMGGFAHHV